MNTRKFKILKAIALLTEIGEGSKITVGEVSRWTKIPSATARRNIKQLEYWGLIEARLFTRGSVAGCKDFRLTPRGVEIYQSQREITL